MFQFEYIDDKKELTKQFSDAYYNAYKETTLKDLEEWRGNTYQDAAFGQIIVDEQVLDFDIVLNDSFVKYKYNDLVNAFARAGSYESIQLILQAIFGDDVVVEFHCKDIESEEYEDYELHIDIYQSSTIKENFITGTGDYVKTGEDDQIVFNNVFAFLSDTETAFLLSNLVCAGVWATFNFFDAFGLKNTYKIMGAK